MYNNNNNNNNNNDDSNNDNNNHNNNTKNLIQRRDGERSERGWCTFKLKMTTTVMKHGHLRNTLWLVPVAKTWKVPNY